MTSAAYQLPPFALDAHPGKEYVFRGPLYRPLTANNLWIPSLPSPANGGFTDHEKRARESTRASGCSGAAHLRLRFLAARFATRSSPIETVMLTLQLLELVNGATLDKLYTGVRRECSRTLRPAPANLFCDSGVVTSNKGIVDVDITGVKRLWLLLTDTDSYNADLIVAGVGGCAVDRSVRGYEACRPAGQRTRPKKKAGNRSPDVSTKH